MPERIEEAFASFLYLPPYNPDFNPIERGSQRSRPHLSRAAERTMHGFHRHSRILGLCP